MTQNNHSYHSSKKMLLSNKYYKKESYPYFNFRKNCKNTRVKDYQVVTAIIYRLKTGCQLPMKQSFYVKYTI